MLINKNEPKPTRRYLLIYTLGGWGNVNHVIVEVKNTQNEPYSWGDQARDIYLALQQGTELTDNDITEIVNDRSYYIAGVDDVDVTLKV